MAFWEYLASESISKPLAIVKTLSRTSGTYGKTYVTDNESPEVTVSLRGTCLDASERASLVAAAMAQDGVVALVDHSGVSWSGRVVSLSIESIRGTALFSATITLRPTDDEEVSPPWTPPFSY